MATRMTLFSFRFSIQDMQNLDAVVRHMRSAGPMLFNGFEANRTSAIKTLIARELIRLRDERDRINDAAVEALAANSLAQPKQESGPETPKARKTRLQRERRAAKREVA